MRVVIADDEPLALARLTSLLAEIEGVELVAAAGSGSDAISAIRDFRPDLAILDIEMPKVDGFDVIETICRLADPPEPPLIALVTAYPQFALQAFETGALDFLCKPVRLSRLEKMIERANRAVEHREAAGRLRELKESLGDLRGATVVEEERSFWIRHGGDTIRVPTEDIDWIKAEGPYASLRIGERSYLVGGPMTALAKQLEADGFIQIHRSSIVNSRKIVRVKSGTYGLRVVLSDGTELPVGRSYRRALRDLTGL
jgi:DNA-binding LytR/AlgR family response regulator